jgi:iron complex outermembrane recepter protein
MSKKNESRGASMAISGVHLVFLGLAATLVVAAGSQAQAVGGSESAAQAQPAPAPPPPQEATGPVPAAQAEQSSGDLAAITVTARKRDESLMAVPVVVTVLSQQTLEKYNATDLTAIGNLVPTVMISDSKVNGGGSLAIRGISSPANQVGFEQDVSVAIDGVQTSNGQVSQLGFFDMQQVEVLKGPQALVFGKNNTAGVISVASAAPTDHFESYVRTGWEFYGGESTTDAMVSGPLSDTLTARLAVRYRWLDGWLRNTAQAEPNPFYNPATGEPASVAMLPGASTRRPGEEEFLGRLTLKFQPSDKLTATFRISGDREDDDGGGVYTQNVGPCVGRYPRVNGIPDPNGDCVANNLTTIGNVPPAVAATIRGEGDINTDGSPSGALGVIVSSLNINAELSDVWNLTSLTGYVRSRYIDFTGDDQTTFSQLATFEDQIEQDISQELRLSSKFAGPVNVVVGGYFERTSREVYVDTLLSTLDYNAAANRYDAFNANTTQPGSTWSGFGQLIWNVTPTLEAAGGVRWTQETKEFAKYGIYGIGPFNVSNTYFPGANVPGLLLGNFKDDNTSPEATVTWRPDDRHTVFAAYRTGFKSGGFGMTNPLQATTTIQSVSFQSETVRGFEVGARGVYLDGRLNVSGDVFDYDFRNLQVNVYDPTTISFNIANAGKVLQRGAEFEVNFRATEAITLHSATAYVHNRFEDYTGQCYSYVFPTGATRANAVPPPNCTFANSTDLTLAENYDGKAPARSPTWSGNAGFDIDVPVMNQRVGLTGDASFSSSYNAADTLAAPTLQGGYITYNASAYVRASDDRWKVSLIGRNLSNKYIDLYAVDRTGGTGPSGPVGVIGEQRGTVTRGRELTLQGEYRFN